MNLMYQNQIRSMPGGGLFRPSLNLKASVLTLTLLLLPGAAWAWSGNTWGSITRETIKANAESMIDFTWTPKNTFTNFQYGSTYKTYRKGTTYSGVAYSQNNPQENLAEFLNAVTNTAGGSFGYGNDCSGFASICWRLRGRKTTASFESQLGTDWFSLGNVGTAPTAPLIVGDALNSSSVGHIVLFLNRESTGVRTLEQTPSNAQRKLRTYSNVAEYRPIRRAQIVDALTFTTEPLSRVVDAGQSATLLVAASGSGPLTYRWYFNGNLIPSATTSQLNFNPVQTSHAGNYTCVVSNTSGAITSRVMSLTVYPRQATVFLDDFEGNTASRWRVNRSSADTRVTFNYDYSTMGIPAAPHSSGGTTRGLKMEANLTAGQTAAVSLSPLNENFAGDYRLRFDAWINANGPFPLGGTGSSEHLTSGVGTTGTRVQWTGAGSSADGVWFAVDGEGQASDTSASNGDFCAFVGTTLQSVASGVYTAGTENNAKGNLHPYYVAAFPEGTTPPAWQRANYAQQTGVLEAGAVGFAWREVIVSRRGNVVEWAVDGIRLAAMTNAALAGSNVFVGYWDSFTSLSDNAALSFCVVDNVRVEMPVRPPTILSPPQSLTVNPGDAATFTVTATGVPAPTFQWRHNGTNLVGMTASTLTLDPVQPTHAGSYSVLVSNVGNSILSAPAVLKVNEPPVITSPPQSQSVQTTSNVTFTVTAVGTPPLFYQWQLNGAPLPGATDSSYTRIAVQLADAGSYSVTVTNLAGGVTSPPAWLTVLPAQAAQFEACARLADGRVHLRWRGEPGWSYTVQAATNLYFSPALQFGPFTSADGWFEFVDDEATNAPQRFYRIQQ